MINRNYLTVKVNQDININTTEILNSNLSNMTKQEIFEWLLATNRITAQKYQALIDAIWDIEK